MNSTEVEGLKRPHSNHSETESDDSEDEATSTEINQDDKKTAKTEAIKKSFLFHRYRGMLWALLSSFVFSLSALLATKLINLHFDTVSIALWRLQGALLPVVPIISYKILVKNQTSKIIHGIWPLTKLTNIGLFGLVLVRSALSLNSLLLHFCTLKYMEMGDALTIAASTPIFVSILARLFLREKCGIVTIIASLFTLIGVVILTRPPLLTGCSSFNLKTLIGSGLALGSMLLSSISYTVLRYIRKVHYSVTILVFGLWGTIENLILALIFKSLNVPSSIEEWAIVLGLIILTFVGQCAITFAMKAEQAGPVAIVRTCDVIFGYAWQIIFLNTIPDLLSVIGSSIVASAVLFCGFRKWLRGLPIGHSKRSMFRYFMK